MIPAGTKGRRDFTYLQRALQRRGRRFQRDAWELHGTPWTIRATTGPSPRHSHATTYDSARSAIFLFGGFDGSLLGDTQELSGAILHGDVNCDCAINALDIEAFIMVLFDRENYMIRYPGWQLHRSDINHDGVTDAADIEPFLELLFP